VLRGNKFVQAPHPRKSCQPTGGLMLRVSYHFFRDVLSISCEKRQIHVGPMGRECHHTLAGTTRA
jgi:hypothetical protein